jgi:nucleobase:cation symporter-1, NCS1 family
LTHAVDQRDGEALDASLEQRTIYHIPPSERHGNVRSLFPVWVAPNLSLVAITTGVLVVLLGLDLKWALGTIVVGNAIGAALAALHSAQGPRMGIPQMVQTRAQFGVFGAVVPMILAVVVLFGFLAVIGLFIGQTFADLFGTPVDVGIAAGTVATVALALVGYRLVHRFSNWIVWPTAVVMLIATITAITDPVPSVADPAVGIGNLLLILSITITYQLGWAVYIADYSRYLPEKDATRKATFWYTYLGLVVGGVWAMSLGAVLALQVPDTAADPAHFVSQLLGSGWAWLALIGLMLTSIQGNVLNLYSMSMTFVAMLDPFVDLTKARRDVKTRWIVCIVACVSATAIAIAGKDGFITDFQNFLVLTLAFLIPWTAINLVDFYLVRREQYRIGDLYVLNGRYGAVNWWTVVLYFLVVAAEVPFINNSYYVGPIAESLNGADISWVVGLVLGGVAYYVLARVRGWTRDADEHFPSAEEDARQEGRPVPSAGSVPSQDLGLETV